MQDSPGRRGYAGESGQASQALFDGISSIASDGRATLFIADANNHRIRSVGPDGSIRTIAGAGACADDERTGDPLASSICAPSDVAADGSGNVYFVERGRILRIGSDGVLSPFGSFAKLASGLAVDGAGNLYATDADTMLVHKIDPVGNAVVLAGEPDSGDGGRAYGYSGDGPAAKAKFAFPDGVAIDTTGNAFIADSGNHRIRRIDTHGFVTTIAGSDPAAGDRGPAGSAFLFAPSDVAVDRGGTVFIADTLNGRIRRVSPNRLLDTVAGSGSSGGRISDSALVTGRIGRNARDFRIDLSRGARLAIDAKGDLLFTDERGNQLDTSKTTAIFGLSSSTITEAIETPAAFAGGIARGLAGELYVSDTSKHRILRIGPDRTITTYAGTGVPGFSGDGGPATGAQLQSPMGLSVDGGGNLLIADFGRIRKVSADGTISTVANEHVNDLAHDRFGNLYAASSRSIHVLPNGGSLLRVAGREGGQGTGEGGPATDARIGDARGIAVSEEGDVYYADAGLHLVRRLTRNTPQSLTIVSGNEQSVALSAVLAQPLVVRVNGRTGSPVPGATVHFTSPDRGILLPASAVTNAQGLVTVRATAGARAGEFRVSAAVTGVPAVEFVVRVGQ